LTTRRACTEFATRKYALIVKYVNLRECRTLFSAAYEILLKVTGEQNRPMRASTAAIRIASTPTNAQSMSSPITN
jgi:hypothetical protein